MNDVDWRPRARALATELTELGALAPAWWDAFAETPRHLFVPTIYNQPTAGSWERIDATSGTTWLDAVYSNRPLVTQFDLNGYATSSSSQPSLMARMMHLAEVEPGHRVLEIGTGTGYNAALLCHRLGDTRVASVDVDPELVESAAERLNGLGYRPALAVGDGADGLPDQGPFDRIIATCAWPTIPVRWLSQLTESGRVLVDHKLTVGAGAMIDLRRSGDRLEGRFIPKPAAFMIMRPPGEPAQPAFQERATDIRQSETTVPGRPWVDTPVAYFLACRRLPPGTINGVRHDALTREPIAFTVTCPDGSWVEVDAFENRGERRVTEAGPTRIWDAIAEAHHQWTRLGSPGWERIGMTVTAENHVVWLDDPTGPEI